MSASREKKNRQTLASQEGYVDPKVQRQAEEAAKARKNRLVYGTIAVIFVVVALLLVVLQSGVLQRNATALTVDGQKFTPAEVNYYYYTAYNNVRSNSYYSYMGLDSSKSPKNQTLNDMAKMILGIDSDEEMTLDAYLLDQAKNNLARVYALSSAAKAEGMTLSDENIAQRQATIDTMNGYAKSNGYTEKQFLKAVYGSTMTPSVFSQVLSTALLADQYQNAYLDSLNFTDAEMEEMYQAEREEFDRADYEYIMFNGTAPTSTDADGNTVEATGEEKAAATAEAKAECEAAAESYAAGESLDTIADSSETGSYFNVTQQQNYGTELSQWVFDSVRTAGETASLQIGDNWYFVVFHSCERPTYNVANVRHILFNADTSALDSSSETYKADSDAIWAEAKAKAEDALANWKSGEATAESFAALATAVSEDSVSAAKGGLISNVNKESSYVGSFKDWCFEDGRKQGDTGIVESTYGYHVMYLDSFGLPYWQHLVTEDLQNHRYAEWIQGFTGDLTVEEGSGMKYVGQ